MSTDRAWAFWQAAKASIDGLMQQLAPVVTQFPPVPVPPHIVKRIRKDVRRFDEKFSMLIHEQKRKAAKK